jgi:hypothetical protein
MSGRGRGAALLERPDEENPAQTKTSDECSHNKQEVPCARLSAPHVVSALG